MWIRLPLARAISSIRPMLSSVKAVISGCGHQFR
jgi:hypothetical protein